MLTTEILRYLNENGLSEIEELRKDHELFLVKFYYDFDKDILDAAKAYANDESDYEEGCREWYVEYYLPYLYDFANDEVLEIIEEIVEENDVAGEVMAFQMDISNHNSVQFMALFSKEDSIISIEEVVKEFIS